MIPLIEQESELLSVYKRNYEEAVDLWSWYQIVTNVAYSNQQANKLSIILSNHYCE